MTKQLPNELTSYDLLKALAIIIMIVDHTGHHFFPDEAWFRIIGRLCIPIWFFLVGYAKTVELEKRLWVGGAIVLASAIIAGQFILPLNIIFTIIVMRFLRQKGVMRCLSSGEGLRGMFFIMFFVTFPTAILFEYGASALFFVIFGYMMRNREEVFKTITPNYAYLYVACAFFAFYIIQGTSLPSVSLSQAIFLLLGFVGVALILWNFRPVVYVDASEYMAWSVIRMIQFMGRRTLEIYVIHILVFRAISMYLYPDSYGFMDWDYVPQSLIAVFVGH